MTSFLLFPALALVIALALILRDANPFRRPETPMLDQLAALGLDGPADPLDGPADLDVDVHTPYGGLEAWLDSQLPFPGAAGGGDCVYCGLNNAVCLCAAEDAERDAWTDLITPGTKIWRDEEDDAWTDYQTALNAPETTGTPSAIALTGVRR